MRKFVKQRRRIKVLKRIKLMNILNNLVEHFCINLVLCLYLEHQNQGFSSLFSIGCFDQRFRSKNIRPPDVTDHY